MSSTPILDVVRCLVAVASCVIGSYAIIFSAYAARWGDWDLVGRYGLFIGAIVAANVATDALWRWRRHHG